jgi:hypothetical protein
MLKATMAVAVLLTMAACGPRIRPEPITRNGAVIPSSSDRVIAGARADGDAERERMAARGQLEQAPRECADPVCMADEMLRQGDEYTAAGRLDLALERYDQADILRPDHAQTNLRIAQVLDKQLRPVEAVLRYRLFIHQLELERLRAEGEVAANIAEAIARAHERIVVLERR